MRCNSELLELLAAGMAWLEDLDRHQREQRLPGIDEYVRQSPANWHTTTDHLIRVLAKLRAAGLGTPAGIA